MKNKLEKMFDYQKYEQNAALQQVVDSVHNRYETSELSLNDMETVYAAGTPQLPKRLRDLINGQPVKDTTTRHG